MKKALRKLFNFVKKYWSVLVSVVSGFVILLFFSRKRGLSDILIKPENDLIDNKVEIGRLQGKKEIIHQQIEKIQEEVKQVDVKLEEADKQIAIEKEKVSDMKPEDKLKKFEDLGY